MPYKYNPFTGNLDFFEASGSSVVSQINTDSGGPVVPASGEITITGGSGLNTSGSGSTVTVNLDSPIIVADGGTGASTAADARTNLGVAIGSDVQAWDAGLDDISGLAVTDGNIIVGDGLNWVAESGATARTSLGLGSIATQAASSVSITGGSITGITDLVVADGGTGASSFTAYAVVCGGTSSTNPLQSIAGVGTSGQVLTSNGAGALPTFQDASGGGGLTWNSIAGTTQTAAVNNGYIVSNSSQTTITLPTTASVGDVVRVAGYGAGGWIIDYGTDQLIHFLGTDTTTTTGNLTSTNRYDSVELICTVADTEFNVLQVTGNLSIT